MDPDETLRLLVDAHNEFVSDEAEEGETYLGTLERVEQHSRDLIEWLSKGGFAPDWTKVTLRLDPYAATIARINHRIDDPGFQAEQEKVREELEQALGLARIADELQDVWDRPRGARTEGKN